MKKYIICFLISTFLALRASAQQQPLDFNNIPNATFPCSFVKNGGTGLEDLITFSTPVELSKYCSAKAQKKISNAQTEFWVGTALEVVGVTLVQVAQSNGGFLFGCAALIGGGVCEILAVSDIIGHFKWDYRRKQVDLYLLPNGATLRF